MKGEGLSIYTSLCKAEQHGLSTAPEQLEASVSVAAVTQGERLSENQAVMAAIDPANVLLFFGNVCQGTHLMADGMKASSWLADT